MKPPPPPPPPSRCSMGRRNHRGTTWTLMTWKFLFNYLLRRLVQMCVGFIATTILVWKVAKIQIEESLSNLGWVEAIFFVSSKKIHLMCGSLSAFVVLSSCVTHIFLSVRRWISFENKCNNCFSLIIFWKFNTANLVYNQKGEITLETLQK
jgi:hypothetical protein